MDKEPTTSFSSTGEDIITQVIDVTRLQINTNDLDDFYEIPRTASEIIQGNYTRIALQFPDELLGDSVPIYRRLKAQIGGGREVYVLADTSYGSCCIDEVAAQHAGADAIVHYGYACLSKTSRLPVIYVFGKKPIDAEDCAQKLVQKIEETSDKDSPEPRHVLLVHDPGYSWKAYSTIAAINDKLQSQNVEIIYNPTATKSVPEATQPAATTDHSPVISTILYIGSSDNLSLTNLLMTNSHSTVISYDPLTKTSQIESGRTNRLLMRRYAAVSKARDSDVFGILVGTLGVAEYLPLIRHLRTLLAKHHKKSYTISVGKLNPSKLGNFMEIECFVLVACPENSLIEAKEFYRPIITPFELSVALSADPSWTGRYVLDFSQLLGELEQPDSETGNKDENGEEEDPDRPMFSLVTGTYRHAKRYGGLDSSTTTTTNGDSTSLVVRSKEDALATLQDSAAAQFLSTRTYQGLEVRIGEDEPSVLEQGRSGIARGYQTDQNVQQ
ncbi:diphthamide biosynthesis protein [Coprinopsis marcescibilis]|uniref:2-(3-amino-3-carboxypropyl)histidine synthase subunit 2 n=1 Tax=Coprinopsis marcescibilis TaxID=230819 RepID=A0A5C3KZI7_COPMA|nr:diphthamide biosynthesis protein [Coprinopsis marcescibilis]